MANGELNIKISNGNITGQQSLVPYGATINDDAEMMDYDCFVEGSTNVSITSISGGSRITIIGNDTVSFDVSYNNGDFRAMIIIVKSVIGNSSKGFDMSQGTPVSVGSLISRTPESFDLDGSSNRPSFDLVATCDWTVSTVLINGSSWLQIVGANASGVFTGSGNATIEFYVSENTTEGERSGNITIENVSDSSDKLGIIVNQDSSAIQHDLN